VSPVLVDLVFVSLDGKFGLSLEIVVKSLHPLFFHEDMIQGLFIFIRIGHDRY